MNGFFCNIKKNNMESIKTIFLSYESFSKIKQIDNNTIFLFEDENTQSYEKNDILLYNLGTLAYNDKWNRDALSEIANKLTSGHELNAIMSETHGQFSLLVILNKQVYLITDKIASFPIYKLDNKNSIQISNIFLSIVRRNNLSLNCQAFAEYLSFDYCFENTLFNEINTLSYGTIYNLHPIYDKKEYHNYLKNINFDQKLNLQETTDKAIEILKKNLKFLNDKVKIFSDLTGGVDSRLNNSLLNEIGLNFETGICGEQVLNETDIAKKISEILNVPFRANIYIKSKDDFRKKLQLHYERCNGVPILFQSTKLINYYHEIKKNFDIHIAGFAGSQLFDNFLPKLSFFSNKLRASNLIKKQFEMTNLFNRKKLSKIKYNHNLSKKINNLLKKFGSSKYNHVSNFFTARTFSNFYHGSILATHNSFFPIYVPYLEADFIRFMIGVPIKFKQNRLLERSIVSALNSEVSNVLTTHGYATTIESIKPRTKIQKIKDVLRCLIYDIPFIYFFAKILTLIRTKKNLQKILSKNNNDFWIDEIDGEWKDNFNINDYINMSKLNKLPNSTFSTSQLKAKILYVNRVMSDVGILRN